MYCMKTRDRVETCIESLVTRKWVNFLKRVGLFCVTLCEIYFGNAKNELYRVNLNGTMYTLYSIYNGLYMNRNIMKFYY